MNGDNRMNDSLALDDEDRLPWLEPAYDDSDDEEVSFVRLGMFAVAGLALLGLIVGAIYLIRNQLASPESPQVIAAPAGDYKMPAHEADTKKFEGEGDASYAASEGVDRVGRIDPSRMPETPMTTSGTADVGSSGKSVPTAVSSSVKVSVIDQRGSVSSTTAVSGPKQSGPVIQLGAFGSEAIARDSWTRLSKRFDYLAELSHSIEPVTVGGTKYYRLRVAVGKDASTLCGRLKVAGESCIVVN